MCLIHHLFTTKNIMHTAQQSYHNSTWFWVLFIRVHKLRLLKTVIHRLQHVYHSPVILGHSLILFLSSFADLFVSLKEFKVVSPAYEASFPFLPFLKAFSLAPFSTHKNLCCCGLGFYSSFPIFWCIKETSSSSQPLKLLEIFNLIWTQAELPKREVQ